MTNEERRPTGTVNSATELRQLIIDNPDLPLVVFAGEDANCNGDFMYNSCSYVSAYVGEFLDCQQTINDEKCYCERDDLKKILRILSMIISKNPKKISTIAYRGNLQSMTRIGSRALSFM